MTNLQKAIEELKDTLVKAKYIKRTGGPGNYKYVYKEGKGERKVTIGRRSKEEDMADITETATKYKEFTTKMMQLKKENLFKDPYKQSYTGNDITKIKGIITKDFAKKFNKNHNEISKTDSESMKIMKDIVDYFYDYDTI
jgi:hypothetical protein